MKVIDLFRRLANGEESPLKIRYDNKIWELDTNINGYYTHTGTISRGLFNEYIRTRNIVGFLDDEVEIIEDIPKEDKKIEKMDYRGKNVNLKIMNEQINKIIDWINDEN